MNNYTDWKLLEDFYVYVYFDENNTPYYVGKGKQKRVISKHNYVQVPSDLSKILVKDQLLEYEAWDLESQLISQYGRRNLKTGTLLNLTNGGYGGKTGWSHSEQTRKRISEKNKGRIMPEDEKQKHRKPKTKQHAENIRRANIGRKDDGRNKKIGLAMSKKRWFHNHKISIMTEPGYEGPDFVPGRIYKGKIKNDMA